MTLLIANSGFDIFEVIAAMCFVHVKCPSKRSPKNVIDSSFSPIKFILTLFTQRQLFPNVYRLLGGLNMDTLDFLTFKDNLLVHNHVCIFINS